MFARETLPLDSLVLDAGTQVRAAIKPRVVELYVAGSGSAAIAFRGSSSSGSTVATSSRTGFIASHASRRAKRSTIEADVRHGTFDDALWFALGATRANGARAHPGDKRRALEIVYRAVACGSRLFVSVPMSAAALRTRQQRSRCRSLSSTPDSPPAVPGSDFFASFGPDCSEARLDACRSGQRADARLTR